MPPLKDGIYRFDPKSITTIRRQLQITQAKLAAELEVPPNTVSRWERGETAPDARALAAIHSIAMERGLTPAYFKKETPATPAARTELLVNLDFQNLGLTANDVPAFDAWLRDELNRRFPHTANRWFKGFCAPHQSAAAEELERLGWRIWEDSDDLDSEIVSQSRSDCGRKPANTILVLGSKDGDFAGLITEMRGKGALVYLTAPAGISQRLAQAVGEDWRIPWPSPQWSLTQQGANAMPGLVVMLDFQNSGVSATDVPKFDDWIRDKVAPFRSDNTNELFKAFCSPYQQGAAEKLRGLKWRIMESAANSDQAIIHHAKSDCGHDPDNTTFVLISRDGDFADLIETLQDWGVSVYGAGPHGASSRLIQAVGSGRWWQMPAIWPAAPVQVRAGLEWLDNLLGRPDLRP